MDALGIPAEKVHVIHHGAFGYLTRLAGSLPPELTSPEQPLVLYFGLIRPYKGVETLLQAWRGVAGAELWVVGMPRVPLDPLRAAAPPGVRFAPRFVEDRELAGLFARADVVVLPYTRTERLDFSGVLATALAFGKPIVLSDIGGFGDVAATGAAALVPPDDPEALRAALQRLIDDPEQRARLSAAAAAAAAGPYSWAQAAGRRSRCTARSRPDRHNHRPMTAIFWVCVALLVYTHAGYPALLAMLAPLRRRRVSTDSGARPSVSVIVAAYAEEAVIEARIANLRALDYPPGLVEVIVACDGSPDATAARAREAGADLVLELPRGGKVRAQDQAVERAHGDLVAFSDANVAWEPGALAELVAPFADERVGYVCGTVALVNERGLNQEGLYWRYEMAIRRLESRLRSVTGGNGAIYATRRDAYVIVDPIMGHDLSFPFNFVKRGWLAVYAPAARGSEKMVPTIEGEFARKRRMMSHGWPIVIRGGMLSPRGYDPIYALMIFSHRVLRYLSPFLHPIALGPTLR